MYSLKNHNRNNMEKMLNNVNLILSNPNGGSNQKIIVVVAAICAISLMITMDLIFVQPAVRNLGETRKSSRLEADFTKAKEQSFGYFTDIRSKDWELMQERVRQRQNHNDEKNGMRSKIVFMDDPPAWYVLLLAMFIISDCDDSWFYPRPRKCVFIAFSRILTHFLLVLIFKVSEQFRA